MIIISGIVFILSQLSLYCWLGCRVVDRIEKLAAEVYDIKWYVMKPSQQKSIQLILLMAQNIKGFNGIFLLKAFATIKVQC